MNNQTTNQCVVTLDMEKRPWVKPELLLVEFDDVTVRRVLPTGFSMAT